MTPERCRELLPVMQGFAEGKRVQWRETGTETWNDVDPSKGCGWLDRLEYRLKPEPRRWWLVYVGSDYMLPKCYWHKCHALAEVHRAKRADLKDVTMVEVQEVLP